MRANLAVLTTLRELQAAEREATDDERAVLARWSGWGALPAVFDAQAAKYGQFAEARAELVGLLSPEEIDSAKRSTINAHYTDASYVQAIWDAAGALGFKGGQVLEPGCGSGTFIGLAPKGAEMLGVELESVTACIAQKLYPQAKVLSESFADTRVAENTFDLVVGNVPFGDVVLHDPRHNPSGHRIHNHFIVKSLHLTRPGGLVAVITSRYTMDAANPAARREMAGLADLVGAVRLPSGAHRAAAGTDVVTDVLLFRRRPDGEEPRGTLFEKSVATQLPGAPAPLRVNEYFLQHPTNVLGVLHAGNGEGGRIEMEVHGERRAGPALEAALGRITAMARGEGLTLSERSPDDGARQPLAIVGEATRQPDGYLALAGDAFTRIEGGHPTPYQAPSTQTQELRALLGLRDTVVALLEAEAGSVDDTSELVGLRQAVNERYDRYVAAFGFINRYTERRTGRIDKDTGEERLAHIQPAQGGFR